MRSEDTELEGLPMPTNRRFTLAEQAERRARLAAACAGDVVWEDDLETGRAELVRHPDTGWRLGGSGVVALFGLPDPWDGKPIQATDDDEAIKAAKAMIADRWDELGERRKAMYWPGRRPEVWLGPRGFVPHDTPAPPPG